MNRQMAVDSRKRATVLPTSGILRHAAARPLSYEKGQRVSSQASPSADGEQNAAPERFRESRFACDFSRVSVHTRAVTADSEVPDEATENLDADGGIPDAGVALPAAVPVALPAPAFLQPVTATFPSHIRAPSTPAGMPDRIPPRVDTNVNVTIDGWRIPMRPVVLSVDGTGGGNGTATINGGATVDLTGSTNVRLQGGTQTGVGNAGNLRLVASQSGATLARSGGFSVSAIPQNFSITFNSELTGARRGIIVNNHWESDSGNVADLNEAQRSEQVQYGASSGILAGYSGLNSGFLPAHSPPTTDRHSTGVATWLRKPSITIGVIGRAVAEQVFIFNDRRTGATNIPVTRSGYRLTREVGQLSLLGQYVRDFGITKAGTATTANGYHSAAGAGSVTRIQRV